MLLRKRLLALRRTRSAALAVSVLTSFLLSCGGGDKPAGPAATAPPQPARRFTLQLSRTTGVIGNPTADSVVADSGTSVAYDFQSAVGYQAVSVLLDGKPAPAVGSVTMLLSRSLAVGTSLAAVGTKVDTAVALVARSVLTGSDPATRLTALLASLDSLTRNRSAADAVTAIRGVRALAYDSSMSSEVLHDVDTQLAGRLFSLPTTVSASRASAQSNLYSDDPVSLAVIFVNGILTSPVEFAENSGLFGTTLIGDASRISHTTGTQVGLGGFYVPSQLNWGACAWEALHYLRELGADWVTVGAKLTKCGDLAAASQDIISILVGGDPSPDAERLATALKGQLRLGRAVILVGHSRGTLVSQQAMQSVLASPEAGTYPARCLGFVSVASPTWKPDGWGAGMSWGTIAAGTYAADLMLKATPGSPKAPTTATDRTDYWDTNRPKFSIFQDAYLLRAGLDLHAFATYVSSEPTRSMIQQEIRSLATWLRARCPRSSISVALTSNDNLSAPVNTTLTPPPVFKVTDASGESVSGLTLHLKTASGSLVASSSYLVGGSGVVEVQVATGGVQGLAVLEASLDESSAPPALLHVTVVAAGAPTISLSRTSLTFDASIGGGNPSSEAVTVTNSGTGSLTGLSTSVNYPPGQPSGWLGAALSSSTAPATLTLTASAGALSVGSYTATVAVSSTASGVTNSPRSVTVTLIVAPAPVIPVASVTISPTSASLTVGATQQFTATTKDASGDILTNRSVVWTSGTQSVATINSSTGVATAVAAGTTTITATSEGRAGSATITVTSSAGAAAKLQFVVQPSNRTGGQVFSPAIKIGVADAAGNIITTATNVILVQIAPGTGTPGAYFSDGYNDFTGTGARAVNGVATISDLAMGISGSNYQLAAIDCGNPPVNGDCVAPAQRLLGATSDPFNVTVGAAARLVFSVEPSTTTSGSAIAPAVRVRVTDLGGKNTIVTAATAITVALWPFGGVASASLSGTKTVSAVNGEATFSNLSISTPGTGYRLTATAPGLIERISVAFDIRTAP